MMNIESKVQKKITRPVNFSLIISIAMTVFVVAMMISVDGQVNYGQVFALLMYVFEFIERIVVLPLYYQNYIRLKEISDRLSGKVSQSHL